MLLLCAEVRPCLSILYEVCICQPRSPCPSLSHPLFFLTVPSVFSMSLSLFHSNFICVILNPTYK